MFHSGRGLRRFDRGQLNLIGKAGQVQGQPIEKLPLRRGGSQIACQPAFGRFRPELAFTPMGPNSLSS
jgi:hypothetical protein